MPEKPMWKQFAENVRLLRKVQNLSLQEVADRAEISKTHVWDIEQERSTNPTIATLVAMARGLGVAPVALLGEMDTPPLHPLAMRVAVEVDRAFRDAAQEKGEILGRARKERTHDRGIPEPSERDRGPCG